MINNFRKVAACVTCLGPLALMSGCSANPASTIPAQPGKTLVRANAAAITVYVSDPVANDVAVYNAKRSGLQLAARITSGISAPAGLAVDRTGKLFVSNTLNNTVTEYDQGGSSPIKTFSQELLGPVDVVVDNGGTLYVANFYSYRHSIVEFRAGSETPSLAIRNPCSCTPMGLALDAQENLYVSYLGAYQQTFVYKYAKGSKIAVELSLDFPLLRWEVAGMTFDSAANLLVANQTLPGVEVFQHSQGSASTVLAKTGSPQFVQLSAAEDAIFVSDTLANDVQEYSYPSGQPLSTISSGLMSAYGVAVSPRAPL
jgi:hypothetical protein